MQRRTFMLTLAALAAALRVNAQGVKVENSEVVDRLKRAFAPPHQAPQLLLDFARWLDTPAAADLPLADGLSGDRGSWTDRLNDFWIEEGSDLAEQFGIFIGIGDGSDVALWNRGGAPDTWPVVLIGGEGEMAVLADDFAGFLARVAAADFDDESEYGWSEFMARDEYEPEDEWDDEVRAEVARANKARKALGAWLAARGVRAATGTLRTPPAALREFCEAHQRDVAARNAASADWREVVRLFAPFAKRGKASWGKELQIVCADDEFHIGELDGKKFTRFDASDAIEAPLRALREARAQRRPAQGLWHSATLRGSGDDLALVARYLNPPDEYVATPRLSAAAVRKDYARKPRSDWWTPGWLREIVR
jgi:hypothetical protein